MATYKGTDGNDRIIAGSGADVLEGYSGNDYLYGDDGGDTLFGDEGSDYLSGGSGTDILFGGDGNDTLNGGPGVDILTGGASSDHFVFRSASAANGDVISDWTALDFIDISGIDANVNAAGDQHFTWIASRDFSAPGQLRYYQYNGDTYVTGSTDSDHTGEFFIQLFGIHELHAYDFLL